MEEWLALLVRSPTRRHPDLRLRAGTAWTVRRLKAELRRLVPEAPPEEDQKLIYAGKLLLDHQHLGELLLKHGEQHAEQHALHLVYNLKTPANAQGTSAEVKAEQPKASAGAAQGPSVSSSAGGSLKCPSGSQAAAETGSRLEATQHACPAVAPAFSAYTTYSLLQISWLQQLYARQYYLQYLASVTSADPSRAQHPQEVPVTPVTSPATLPGPFPAPNQDAAAQVNAEPNQNLQMNAQGGALMEEEEEGANRDWLDWLYSATLFYVFVNIVYFYSSVSRFLLVMGGTVLMYLHHLGWLPFWRRPIQPFPGNAAVAPPAADNQDQNNNLQGGNVAGAEHPEERQAVQGLQQASPSLLGTAWVFFKTFFASLLPEGPGVTRN